MDKNVERKIGLLHSAAGAAAGIIFGLQSLTVDTIIVALAIGIIMAYPLKPLCIRLFNLVEGEFLFKEWIYKGYLLFFVVWIVVWTFVYNLL